MEKILPTPMSTTGLVTPQNNAAQHKLRLNGSCFSKQYLPNTMFKTQHCKSAVTGGQPKRCITEIQKLPVVNFTCARIHLK